MFIRETMRLNESVAVSKIRSSFLHKPCCFVFRHVKFVLGFEIHSLLCFVVRAVCFFCFVDQLFFVIVRTRCLSSER